jgi:hypothetical protein
MMPLSIGLGMLPLGSCASSRKSAAPPPVQEGTFDFFGRAGERVELRGAITIIEGEVRLNPEAGLCREDLLWVSAERVRFTCDTSSDLESLAFVIDKRYPLTRSTWSAHVRQRRTRTVCVQYSVQNGRRVCVRTETEWYDEITPMGGPLTFRARR